MEGFPDMGIAIVKTMEGASANQLILFAICTVVGIVILGILGKKEFNK